MTDDRPLCWCGCGRRVRKGGQRYVTAHALRKLTGDDVIEIRRSKAQGIALADFYGVCPQTITNVRHGVFYGDVAPDGNVKEEAAS